MSKQYHPIQSLTSGLVTNYPPTIYMSEFSLRSWGTLNLAYQNGEESMSAALTGVLDACIDFEKTGFIRTSDQLTPNDRKKLFLWQKLQTDTPDIEIVYKCPRCGQSFSRKYDISDFREVFITQKPEPSLIELRNGTRVHLYPFTKARLNEYDKIMGNFIETGIETEYLKIVDEPDVDAAIMAGLTDSEEIQKFLLDAPKKKKISTDDFTTYLLDFYPMISEVEGRPEVLASLASYVEFLYDEFNKKDLTLMEKFIATCHHGISYEAEVRCDNSECDFVSKEEIPSNLGFFLGIS